MAKIAIAPMLDWTDRHYRYFMRQVTKCTELYTEMIVADAILHGNVPKLLSYSEVEQPLVMQLGGSDPTKLATASKICQDYGYSAINLNVGCPSDRVKSGNFGACLMQTPEVVAQCIKSMQDAVTIPVTVKHRVGLDYNDDYSMVHDFVATVAQVGCTEFIVHARNAVLHGLSPKQNREIPPLKYEYVYQLKKDFPHLTFIINGGIKTIDDMQQHLKFVDGVMIGREAYYNPFLFSSVDTLFYNNDMALQFSRRMIADNMLDYLIVMQQQNIPLHHITRHMIGLYHGCSQAKLWRYTLTNEMIKTNNINTYTNLLSEMID
jgi:tRNA-dihydrouridine synthase A